MLPLFGGNMIRSTTRAGWAQTKGTNAGHESKYYCGHREANALQCMLRGWSTGTASSNCAQWLSAVWKLINIESIVGGGVVIIIIVITVVVAAFIAPCSTIINMVTATTAAAVAALGYLNQNTPGENESMMLAPPLGGM